MKEKLLILIKEYEQKLADISFDLVVMPYSEKWFAKQERKDEMQQFIDNLKSLLE